jgi:hypothetical protein
VLHVICIRVYWLQRLQQAAIHVRRHVVLYHIVEYDMIWALYGRMYLIMIFFMSTTEVLLF